MRKGTIARFLCVHTAMNAQMVPSLDLVTQYGIPLLTTTIG